MRYRSLGRSGLKVSELSLGGWTTYGDSVQDKKSIREIIVYAYEAGINFFDIADIYGKGATETAMGVVLKEFPRHRLVISSKVFWPMSEDINDRGLSRKHILESVEKSLKRIGTDYLDLYFCHRYDENTPLEETVRAMDDLVHQGKVLYWGTSEWSGEQLRAMTQLCASKNFYQAQVEQPQYNLLTRARFEQDVKPVAVEAGMGLVTWSPLASGALTGKYDESLPKGARLTQIPWLRDSILTQANLAKVRQFKKIAEELGTTRSQLALAWLLAQPGISSVITGATRLAQLQENLAAMELKIAEPFLFQIDNLFGP